jgi:hypothetical protein
MARESVLYSNEHRQAGPPNEADFTRLYNLFNDTSHLANTPTVSEIVTPLLYEQFGYAESQYEELARVWALYGNTDLGSSAFNWEDIFGMPLAAVGRAALIVHGWVVRNAGFVDRSLFDAPQMQEVFERVAPRDELIAFVDHFTMTVSEAHALHREASAVASSRQRFAFNPFVARPFIDLGGGGVWAPQSMLVSRAIFPSNLYYVGIKKWGKAFADELGTRVERYVGRHLQLVAGKGLEGEIEYEKGQKSVDWIWVTDRAVVLVECKSARMTLGAKAADASLSQLVERSIGKGRKQVDRTASLIQNRHPAFAHIPTDRPIIGVIVTAEPFYLANAAIALPEYGDVGQTGSQVVSLRELEHLVCLRESTVIDILQSAIADPEKRTWSLASVLEDYGPLPKNPILNHAWSQYNFRSADLNDDI